MFRVGQKVTCIDDSGFMLFYNETMPVKGHDYTIRTAGACVRLKEIVNPPHQYTDTFAECSFKAARFKAKTGKK